MDDKRVIRRGVNFRPRAQSVREARYRVKLGLPIHRRWLPFLTPKQREVAIVEGERECSTI